MDEDIAEEGALFLLQRRSRRGNKRKKSVKTQDFGLETFFVKGSNMENIATGAGTEN